MAYACWWRSSICRPAQPAALNIVVEAEQIPPPIAPVWLLRPPMMTPPRAKPCAGSIGPTAPRKLNCWPGPMTRPLRLAAGWRMFLPLPLLTSGKNVVVHVALPPPMITMPETLAMSVIFGRMGAVTTSRLAAPPLPEARESRLDAIAWLVAMMSMPVPSTPALRLRGLVPEGSHFTVGSIGWMLALAERAEM